MRPEDLADRMRVVNRVDLPVTVEDGAKPETWPCAICKGVFPTQATFMAHHCVKERANRAAQRHSDKTH